LLPEDDDLSIETDRNAILPSKKDQSYVSLPKKEQHALTADQQKAKIDSKKQMR
jgi:hypothetical protein